MPKKAFFFSCNFSHIWQAVQLEMTMCTIVTLGDVLNKLGKATCVPVGGRRKSLEKKVGRIRVKRCGDIHHLCTQEDGNGSRCDLRP